MRKNWKKELNAIVQYANNCDEDMDTTKTIEFLLKKLLFVNYDESMLSSGGYTGVIDDIRELYWEAQKAAVFPWQKEYNERLMKRIENALPDEKLYEEVDDSSEEKIEDCCEESL